MADIHAKIRTLKRLRIAQPLWDKNITWPLRPVPPFRHSDTCRWQAAGARRSSFCRSCSYRRVCWRSARNSRLRRRRGRWRKAASSKTVLLRLSESWLYVSSYVILLKQNTLIERLCQQNKLFKRKATIKSYPCIKPHPGSRCNACTIKRFMREIDWTI